MAYVKVVKSSAYYSRYQVSHQERPPAPSSCTFRPLMTFPSCCRSSTSAGVRCAAARHRWLSISSCQQEPGCSAGSWKGGSISALPVGAGCAAWLVPWWRFRPSAAVSRRSSSAAWPQAQQQCIGPAQLGWQRGCSVIVMLDAMPSFQPAGRIWRSPPGQQQRRSGAVPLQQRGRQHQSTGAAAVRTSISLRDTEQLPSPSFQSAAAPAAAQIWAQTAPALLAVPAAAVLLSCPAGRCAVAVLTVSRLFPAGQD